MAKWLDKDGTSYLWEKIKSNFASKSDAIKNITRSGTTFTATKADGTTFTFTQQDNNNNTTYTLTQDSSDGHKITLTPSSGSATTITIPDNNTWRGIQDNLTSSTNTTESLSAKQGYLLANGSARDNTKLPLSGGTVTGNVTHNSETADLYKIARKKDNGGGWAYAPIRYTGNDDAVFFRIGAFGSANNFSYAFIGTGDYNEDLNLKVYSDGTVSAKKFSGPLTGDVIGNCSGSAGSVAWANVTDKPSTYTPSSHTHNYLPLSGGTLTGQLKTSFKTSIAPGMYLASAATIPDLLEEVRYSSGCGGSFNLGTAYTLSGITISTGWYNFWYVPHRSGGINGAASGDNCNYGSLWLSGMTVSGCYMIRYSSGAITELRNLYTDTNTWRPIGTGATDAAAGNHTHTLKIGNKSLSVSTSEQTWALHDILKTDTVIGTSTSWNQTTPGVYQVGSSATFTGTGNPESTNGGLAPYRYGQLIVSKADTYGIAQFYISHQDSANSSYGIKFRSGWNNSYLTTWKTLLDSSNYSQYALSFDGTNNATRLRVINNSSNNSDDAMVYLENKSASDWAMKINKDTSAYGIFIQGTSTNLLKVGSNGALYVEDNATSGSGKVAVNGSLTVTKNGNTVTIGSQNSGWCHFQNSTNIGFHFSNFISATTKVEVYNSQTDLTAGKLHLKNGNIQYNATTQALDFIFS